MTWLSAIRQLLFPREFRIAASQWPVSLEQSLLRLARFDESAPRLQGPAFGEDELRLLADIGTGLWRLKQRMVKPGTSQPLDEMHRPFRHLESVWDALIQGGAEIRDHTDEPFDPGLSLKVVSYQPTPGLGRERVIETIKPTIYFKGTPIQMGEVIVGRPEKHETPPGDPQSPAQGKGDRQG
jgi:hypothetical protein